MASKADFPLFIFTAILPWKWFTETIQGGVNSIVSGERLIKQIYFPKLVLPLASSASGLVVVRVRADPAGSG